MILESALLCMSLNIYHEAAKDEPLLGMAAIAQVTLNRAKRDPAQVCDVVFAPKQFSWTNGKIPSVDETSRAWRNAQDMARLSFSTNDFTLGADHYHALYVSPYWKHDPRLTPAGLWGSHAFYKQKAKK